jgi:uncharacterized repeat protein (TIGR02543 family)
MCYAHWTANRYTVTFNANEGTGGKTVTQDYGTALSAPTVTRTGYTFKGWSPSVPSTVPAGNVTYTAQWQINKYRVTFDANGGIGGKSVTQDYGTSLSAPTVTRTGYTFKGWSPSIAATIPAGNVTYTAQWQANRYTVIFDANGGTGDMIPTSLVYGVEYTLASNRFENSGRSFVGWSLGPEGSVEYEDGTTVSNMTVEANGIVRLYAYWAANQYMVTFDANGGTGGKTTTQNYGTAIVVPEVTREGYSFMGWLPALSGTVPASNVTYTAQWHVNQYAVTFNANGGTGGKTVTQDYGTALSVPTVTRTGYSFTGWSPGVPSKVPAGNVTYTAQWHINQYTVTFNANGGTGGKSVTQDYGTALFAPTVTRTGYTFTGWSPSVSSTVPAGNVTYTAQWTANQYTVTFDANGGAGGTSGKQDYGTAIVVPTVTREGYTFAGWSPAVAVTVPASDVTYTAQWTVNQYTVTFNANGGDGSMDDQAFVYDKEKALSPALFAVEDYRFVGWAQESDGEVRYGDGEVVSNLTAEADGRVTLYAVWEIWTAPMQVCDDAFGGVGLVTLDEDGRIVVTLTNDVSGTVEVPDNVGNVTIDLNGHDMVGDSGRLGEAALPGGPAIRIVSGEGEGETTWLAIVDTSDSENGQVAGGGDAAGIEIAEDAASGVCLDVEEGVTVLNGDGSEQEFKPKLAGTGTVTVPKTWKTGQKVTWKAKADKGSVFARWEGPLVESLGLSRNERRNPLLAFAVPDGFETNQVTAVFIPFDDDGLYELALTQTEFELKAAVDGVWVRDDSESYVTASASGLPAGLKFDAKTLRITGAPTKGGVYWVQLKGKNASGYQWAENVKVTVSGGGAEAKEPKLTRTAYYPLTVISTNAAAGTVTGTGVYAEGKKAAIKATAAKGYVFAGWYEDSRLTKPATFENGDFRTASQNAVVPGMRYVFARFVTAEEDKAGVSLAVDGAEMRRVEDNAPYQTNVMCGVYMEWPVAVEALSLPTVAVSGLPTGLKFTAKPLTSKVGSGKAAVVVTNVPANTIYGTPTAASKVDAKTGVVKPSVVKVTVTTAGKSKVVYEIDVTVDAVKEWAVGTFDGGVGGTGNGEPGTGGLVTLTVSAAGKVSGKLLEGGKTWTLSAPNFDAFDAEAGIYTATVLGKSGKEMVTNEVTIAAETVRRVEDNAPYQRGVVNGRDVRSPSATGETPVVPVEWTAWQNLWKVEPWKSDAKPFAKAPQLALYMVDDNAVGRVVLNAPPDAGSPYGTLSLKFASSGAVTASGKFVTGQDAKGKDVVYSASCSSVLVPAGGDAYTVYLYFPPKAGKFEGYAAEVPLVWDGSAFSLGE